MNRAGCPDITNTALHDIIISFVISKTERASMKCHALCCIRATTLKRRPLADWPASFMSDRDIAPTSHQAHARSGG